MDRDDGLSTQDRTRGWLERLARRGGGREAVLVDPSPLGGEAVVALDHVALAARAAVLAEALEAFGARAGDLVAVSMRPSPDGVALVHALLDRRLVLLPLHLRWTEREQSEALRRAGARFLVVGGDDDGRGARLAEAVGCTRLVLEPAPEGTRLVRAGAPDDPPPPRAEHQRRRLAAQDAALVLFTSGTSGRSKGAVLGFDNLVASAEASARLLGSDPDDRWLLCMPLFHVAGLQILVRSGLLGTAVVLHDGFDAARVARALDRARITRVSFVATMLEKLLDERGGRPAPDALALVLLGGGPASSELLARARAAGYPIAPTYGLTEAASQVATRPPFADWTDPGDLAAGLQPLPGVSLRIVDGEGRVRSTGEEGEIQVRGPIVMKGYLGDPAATQAALVDGWLRTGDAGRLDADGRLRVLDRRADLIVSGGENVYPAEIESALADHPDVAEAGVVGMADARFGARPVAFVVARPGCRIEPGILERHCRERLAAYKVPDAFVELPSLPRTSTGKLLRRELAAHATSG
jgi:O-succinylbenzoic acid--CoA ligase